MFIDLRSDTVTQPTPEIREVMCRAKVGDDVMDCDPTVARLEEMSAEMLGKEAGMFVPSGTQSNLCALLSHCGRGDEYLVGQTAHTYLFEGGGAAVFGSIQPQSLDQEQDGTLDLDKLAALVKPDDFHFARTKLLCLENTTWGKVLPFDYLKLVQSFASDHQLSLHLDGARLFNASTAAGISAIQLAKPFESVSICLSKGLGAPVGSVLVASVSFIKEAKRWRKMLGGGMRQSGMLAAAGIYVLENNIERLVEDHENARKLGQGLAGISKLKVDPIQTNMVFVDLSDLNGAAVSRSLEAKGIKIGGYTGGKKRLVTHLGICAKDIEHVVESFEEACTR
jgi:threonine aldolase